MVSQIPVELKKGRRAAVFTKVHIRGIGLNVVPT
jgi:hypothetical protein